MSNPFDQYDKRSIAQVATSDAQGPWSRKNVGNLNAHQSTEYNTAYEKEKKRLEEERRKRGY